MPLHDYKCNECGHQFEKLVGKRSPEPRKCPVCKKNRLTRLLLFTRPPAVHMRYSPMHPRHGRGMFRRGAAKPYGRGVFQHGSAKSN